MQPEQTPSEQRVNLIIWAAMLAAVVLYFVVMRFVPAQAAGDSSLVMIFIAMAAVMAAASFAVESRVRAAPRRTGYIIALALCDAAAIMGVVAWFVTGSSKSYYALAIGAAAMFLHFPGREESV